MDCYFWLQYGTMEEIQTMLGYHENIDNLRKMLHDATLKLHQHRATVDEEMRRSNEKIEKLIKLLKKVTQERDEAMDHVQILLGQVYTSTSPVDHIQERSLVPSYVDLRHPFNVYETKDVSNIGMAGSCSAGHNANSSSSVATRVSTGINEYGPYSDQIFNQLLMNKDLREKGKQVQNVTFAGRDLETQILLAGVLPPPQWKNPPSIELRQSLPVAGNQILSDFEQILNFLNVKLNQTNVQLQSLRTNAKEQMRRNEEKINKLFQLLKNVTQERDEATDQIHIILKSLQQNSYIMVPLDFINYRSKGLSDVDMSNFCTTGVPQLPIIPQYDTKSCNATADVCPASSDYGHRLLKDGALPEKGKLLKAMIDAGQELHTFLSMGAPPLPRWRNPPPSLQLSDVPPAPKPLSQKRKRERNLCNLK